MTTLKIQLNDELAVNLVELIHGLNKNIKVEVIEDDFKIGMMESIKDLKSGNVEAIGNLEAYREALSNEII